MVLHAAASILICDYFLGLALRVSHVVVFWHWLAVAPFLQCIFFQPVRAPLCLSSLFFLSFLFSFLFARLRLAGVLHVCFCCCPLIRIIRDFGSPRPASARVVRVCFCCCPSTRGFDSPRPASARRGYACLFLLLSFNSRLWLASPGFSLPGPAQLQLAGVVACNCCLFVSVLLSSPWVFYLGNLGLLGVALIQILRLMGLLMAFLSLWVNIVPPHRSLAASLGAWALGEGFASLA